MLHRIGGLLIVGVLIFPTTGLGQLTTTKKPPIIRQGPALKPIAPTIGSTLQDTLQARRFNPVIGDNPLHYTSYQTLSWKEKDRREQFMLTHIGPTYAKGKVSVYLGWEPPATFASTALSLQPINQLQKTDKNSALVYTANFENIQKGVNFTIDFGSFTPFGGISRNIPTQIQGSVGRPKPVGSKGGENPPALVLSGPALARAAKTKNDYLAVLIANQGYIRFFVQFQPEGGNSSTIAAIDYGEPQPSVGVAAQLEAFDGVEKGEQHYDHWSTKVDWSDLKTYQAFRWTADVDNETQAIWEISDQPFPLNPVLHGNVVNWGQLTGVTKAGTPLASAPQITPQIAYVIGAAGDVDKDFYFRVVLFNSDGTLACAPSNAVKIVRLKKVVKNEPPPPPSTWMEFSTHIVGYEAPYMEPTDPYQFLLTRKPTSDFAQWQKLTGKSNPGEGDPVYLPPAPPPEEKAWYEKVVDVINYFISKLGDIAEAVQTVAYLLEQVFVNIPITIGNNLAKEAQLDKAAAAIGLDQGFAAAGWIKGKADTAINMAAHADYFAANVLDQAGVPAAQWINARGKVQTAIYNAGHDARPTNPTNFDKLLVPNPDFATHPAYVYLKVHATQKGDKSKPLVAPAGTYRLFARGAWTDPGTLGGNSGWMDMYEKYVTLPSMSDGMDMVDPIAIDYHHSYYDNKVSWRYHYQRVTKIQWQIGYSDDIAVNGTKSWGSH